MALPTIKRVSMDMTTHDCAPELKKLSLTDFSAMPIKDIKDADFNRRLESLSEEPLASEVKAEIAMAGFEKDSLFRIACDGCKTVVKMVDNIPMVKNVLQLHITQAPYCFFSARFTKKIKYPWMANFKDRVSSLNNAEWLKTVDRPRAISMEQWAQMGVFILTPGDVPVCFACGHSYFFLGREWSEKNIWSNHAYESPRCPYLSVIKGPSYIRSEHDGDVPERVVRFNQMRNC